MSNQNGISTRWKLDQTYNTEFKKIRKQSPLQMLLFRRRYEACASFQLLRRKQDLSYI